MKSILVSLSLVLLFYHGFAGDRVFGQNVNKIDLTISKIQNISVKYEDRGSVRYELHLDLQFKNLSERPLIMLKQDFWLAGESLFVDSLQGKERPVYSSSHLSPNSSSLASVVKWRKAINKIRPPSAKFAILAPKESFETTVSISIYVLKMDKQHAEVWEAIQNGKPLSLKIDVEMFPRGYNTKFRNGESFVEHLCKKWGEIGRFQTDVVSSKPIRLTFEGRSAK